MVLVGAMVNRMEWREKIKSDRKWRELEIKDLNGSQNWRGILGSYGKIETTAVITKKRDVGFEQAQSGY